MAAWLMSRIIWRDMLGVSPCLPEAPTSPGLIRTDQQYISSFLGAPHEPERAYSYGADMNQSVLSRHTSVVPAHAMRSVPMIQLTLTCSLVPAVAMQGWRWRQRARWQPGRATFHLHSTNRQPGDTASHAWEVPAAYLLLHQHTAPTHGRYVVDWMAASALRTTLIEHIARTYAAHYRAQAVLETIRTMNLLLSWEVGHTPSAGSPPWVPDCVLFRAQLAPQSL